MSTKTPNYQLNQWEPSDQFVRTDFNEDNAKIDAALSAERSAREAAERTIPKFAAGSYTGDGQTSRFISVGFTPKAVLVLPGNCELFSPGSYPAYYSALTVQGRYAEAGGGDVLTLSGGGFFVSNNTASWGKGLLNVSDRIYHYIALG